MDRKSAIKKAVKLIDRFHGSSSENEKATAKRQALSLCATHKITRDELWHARGGKPAYGADHQKPPVRPQPKAQPSYKRKRGSESAWKEQEYTAQKAKEEMRQKARKSCFSSSDDEVIMDEAHMRAVMSWLKDHPESADILKDGDFINKLKDILDDAAYDSYYYNDYY